MLTTLRARLIAGVGAPWGASLALTAGLLGAGAGALLAEGVVRVLPLPTGGLEAARAAGILSQTTWAGYPKQAELLFLGIGLALSMAGGLAAAVAVAWRRGAQEETPRPAAAATAALPRLAGWDWAVLLALFAFGAQPAPLHTAGRLYLILAEEGAHLAALTTLLHGGRLYAEMDYLYGPLLLAPLLPVHWVEPSVYGVRIGTLLLHGLGLAAVAGFARPLFRTRAGWILLVILLAWCVPLPAPRLHLTAWRSALAFAPFLFLPRALEGGRGGALGVGAGVALAVLTGPDLLTAALIAPLAALLLGAPRRTRALAGLAVGLGGGLALGLLLLSPLADPVGWARGFADKLGAVRMGYLARMYPEPWGADRLWRGDPFGVGMDVSRYVWAGNAVVIVAAGCLAVAAFALLRRFRGRAQPRDALLLAFCLGAALLLPKLVSRPGNYQFAKVLPGILVGATALCEDALRRLAAARRSGGGAAVLPFALPTGAALLALALLAASNPVRPSLPRLPPDHPVYEERLGPIALEPGVLPMLREVRWVVDQVLPPGEPLWAGPAAPGWSYFLDRPPAAPLSITFVTTTNAARRALRDRLAEDPPPIVLFQRDRTEFEGVPMRRFLGPAADWIDAEYERLATSRRGGHVVDVLVHRSIIPEREGAPPVGGEQVGEPSPPLGGAQ